MSTATTQATRLSDQGSFSFALTGIDTSHHYRYELTLTDRVGLSQTLPQGILNTLPITTVSLDTRTPRTNGVLTATATKSDADGDPVSVTFAWEVNGVVRQTRTLNPNDTPLTDTFDPSVSGNVDVGNVITVVVTPNDGIIDGAPVTDTATVVDTMRTWDGGGTGNNNWTNAANWAGNVVPVAGDRLVFAANAQAASFNDFADGTIFQSITFQNGNFTLSGHAVVLNPQGGVAIDSMAGYNSIALPLTLAPASTGITIVEGGMLELGANARSPVLTGGGANLTGGVLLLDYTTGSDPASTVESLLATSFSHGFTNTADHLFDTSVTSYIGLGWADSPTINGHAYANQIVVMPALYGNANLDGVVGGYDLGIVIADYTKTGMTWATGDFTYDGTVDGYDLGNIVGNYSRTGPVTPNISSYNPAPMAVASPSGGVSTANAAPAASNQPVVATVSAADQSASRAATAAIRVEPVVPDTLVVSISAPAVAGSKPVPAAAPAATDGVANVHVLSSSILSTIAVSPPAVVRAVPAAVAKAGSVAPLNAACQAALHDACFDQPAGAMPASTVRITASEDALLGVPVRYRSCRRRWCRRMSSPGWRQAVPA